MDSVMVMYDSIECSTKPSILLNMLSRTKDVREEQRKID